MAMDEPLAIVIRIPKADMDCERKSHNARFLHGLNRNIQDIIILLFLPLYIKPLRFNLNLEGMERSPTLPQAPNGRVRIEEKRNSLEGTKVLRRKVHPSKATKKSNIKCFKCLGKGHIASQCLNKRTMILIYGGDIDSETSTSRSEGYSNKEVSYEGGLLMVRKLMSAFIEDSQPQRENIFHSSCMVKGKCCSLIIDGGSSVNVTSVRLVEKHCLPTILHPKPYKLQWLSEKGEMIVDK
ncbi:hypothetical protein CR513_35117, partial [Mucuna pruriens]